MTEFEKQQERRLFFEIGKIAFRMGIHYQNGSVSLKLLKGTFYKMVTKDNINQLVQYWDDGLRTGYLKEVNNKRVTIQPIGPKGTKPHPVEKDIYTVVLYDQIK